MGRKGKWLGAVKKVFIHDSNEDEKSRKSKKKWGFGKTKHPDLDAAEETPSSSIGTDAAVPANASLAAPVPTTATVPRPHGVKFAENEQSNKHDNSVAMAAVAVAEAAIAARAEVAPLAVPAVRFAGKSREESAAIKIQTAFRGHMARRALRASRGLIRLKAMVESNSVKRQAATTLRCMQTLARVQSQIRSRRIRMAEENQALQRQLLLNRERELEKLRMGEWDDSLQSKEQIEASMLSKHEATIRRERALAYAFSHQWKSTSKTSNPLFTDPNNPHWGWSWLERWMAARPWETKSTTEKETGNDQSSVKSAATRSSVGGGEIAKAYARRDANPDQPSPVAKKPSHHRQSLGTPSSKSAGKIKSAGAKGAWAPTVSVEDDSKSLGSSIQSERPRRHSIAGSSVGDDESLASSPAVPSYMAHTESARAKSRFQSSATTPDKAETPPEKAAPGSAKKRLSFPAGGAASPAIARRHSGPPKVNVPVAKDVAVST